LIEPFELNFDPPFDEPNEWKGGGVDKWALQESNLGMAKVKYRGIPEGDGNTRYHMGRRKKQAMVGWCGGRKG